MRRISQESADRVAQAWEGIVADRADDAVKFAGEIFAANEIIGSTPALARNLTNPARSGEDRAELARGLFSSAVSGEVGDLLVGLAREPFAVPEDLEEAIDHIGVETLLVSAQLAGRLDKVGEELYRAVVLLSEQRELRRALGDQHASLEAREGLAKSVFATLQPESLALIVHSLAAVPARTIVRQLTAWIDLAGERAKHLVAIVTVATPMESDQEERLVRILSERYGRPVEIHVGVNPAIVGGIRISVGSDIIDGTLATRLKSVRSAIVER